MDTPWFCTEVDSGMGYLLGAFEPKRNESEMKEKLNCVHTMPAHFENGDKVTDRRPVHKKTAHFLPENFENVRF